MSKAQLRRFMDEILNPRLRGFVRDHNIQSESGNEDEVFGTETYRHPDGRVIHIGGLGRGTGSAPFVYCGFSSLLLGALQAVLKPGEKLYGPTMIAEVKRLKPMLEDMRIRGFCNFENRLTTWDEWITSLEKRDPILASPSVPKLRHPERK